VKAGIAVDYEIIDISQEIYQGMPVFPPHQPTMIFPNISHDESLKKMGFMFATNNLLLSEHGPTHTDAPYEYDLKGETIDRLPLEKFFGQAFCVDLKHIGEDSFIGKEDLREALEKAGFKITRGDILLIHTGHFARSYGTDKWLANYTGLSYEAAAYLAKSGIKMIGVDAPSVDKTGDVNYSAHKACREYGMLNTENLCNLDKLIGKKFLYIGFPLRIRNGTGSPVRAVAVVGGERRA
jgi:kynurenine formamidase